MSRVITAGNWPSINLTIKNLELATITFAVYLGLADLIAAAVKQQYPKETPRDLAIIDLRIISDDNGAIKQIEVDFEDFPSLVIVNTNTAVAVLPIYNYIE